MVRFGQNECGSVLSASAFFISMLTVGGLTLVTLTRSSSQFMTSDVALRQAFQVGHSGIEYAIRRSQNTGNWHWSETCSSFAGGSLAVEVEDSTLFPSLEDTLQIRVFGSFCGSGNRQVYRIRLSDLSGYAVYVSGDINSKVTVRDSNGAANPARASEFSTEMPDIDDDLLQQLAISQGHYFSGNLSIADHYPIHPDSTFFHIRPDGTPSDTPNVIWVDGNLEVKNGGQIAGIIVVTGDVSLKNSQHLNGVLYLPNPVSVIQDVDMYNKECIYGGVIGAGNITGLGNPNKISIFHRQSYLSRFYGLASTSGLPFVVTYRFWREL